MFTTMHKNEFYYVQNPVAMKTAADILRHKAPAFNTIAADATVFDAVHLMNSMNRTFLVVMEGDSFQGLFTEHDYVRNVVQPGWDPEIIRVGDVMSRHLPAISPESRIDEIIALMISHHTRLVPVFHGHQFDGIITINNVIKEFLHPGFGNFSNRSADAGLYDMTVPG